jgi:hypothetical protein
MISQLPTPAPGDIEKFLITATAILSMTAVGKKFFPGKRNDSDLATKAELQSELNAIRDKIDARFVALAEKVDQLSKSVHERLTELQSNLARVDERTKK